MRGTMDKNAKPPTTKDKNPEPEKRDKTPEWVKGTIEPTTKK